MHMRLQLAGGGDSGRTSLQSSPRPFLRYSRQCVQEYKVQQEIVAVLKCTHTACLSKGSTTDAKFDLHECCKCLLFGDAYHNEDKTIRSTVWLSEKTNHDKIYHNDSVDIDARGSNDNAPENPRPKQTINTHNWAQQIAAVFEVVTRSPITTQDILFERTSNCGQTDVLSNECGSMPIVCFHVTNADRVVRKNYRLQPNKKHTHQGRSTKTSVTAARGFSKHVQTRRTCFGHADVVRI